MAEKTQYVIELNDKLSPGLKKAIANATGLDNKMSGVSKRGSKGMGMLGGAIKSLAGPLALAAAAFKGFQFASESVAQARNFESLTNAINFASGSVEEGAKNMEFLRQRSELLGTDLLATTEGFKQFSGAMIGTSLEGQATRDIFDGVNVAASVMGLSADDAKGSFLALSQMMGKGKVSAEELRGQLGERIPGAFNIAARAMGVTSAELDKMMSNGELMAEDFLPKFSDELKKTFGPGLEKSVNSAQANLNRFNNTMLEIKLILGRTLLPVVNSVMSAFKKGFQFLKRNIDAIKVAFQPLIDLFNRYREIYSNFLSELSGGQSIIEMFKSALTGIGKVLRFLEPLWNSILGIIETLFKEVVKIWGAFDGLLTRFPIIGKTFRGLVFVIREGFITIAKEAKTRLGGVGDLLSGVFSGDTAQIKQGLKGLALGLAGTGEDLGENFSNAWRKGFNEGFDTPDLKVKGLTSAKPANFDDVLKSGARGPGGTTAAGLAGAGGKKASTKLNGVKSGRPTNINIDIGKLIETFNVTATNLEDINNKTKDLVAQALLSAVNNVNNIAR